MKETHPMVETKNCTLFHIFAQGDTFSYLFEYMTPSEIGIKLVS